MNNGVSEIKGQDRFRNVVTDPEVTHYHFDLSWIIRRVEGSTGQWKKVRTLQVKTPG